MSIETCLRTPPCDLRLVYPAGRKHEHVGLGPAGRTKIGEVGLAATRGRSSPLRPHRAPIRVRHQRRSIHAHRRNLYSGGSW